VAHKENPARHADNVTPTPASQAGEDKGKIKHKQQTDATMAGKDLPQGSEPETHDWT